MLMIGITFSIIFDIITATVTWLEDCRPNSSGRQSSMATENKGNELSKGIASKEIIAYRHVACFAKEYSTDNTNMELDVSKLPSSNRGNVRIIKLS